MRGDPDRIGPYRIVRKLGQGGMGVVYEARHPMVPRPLALKLVLERNASEKARARFFREAEALARVRHPGVVQVHQLGRAAEGPYLVQEMVEGDPLSKVCARGPLEPSRAARLAREVALAVEAIHAIGVLHRDIKPQNVMLRPDDRPVLLDFGLARDENAERLTKTGEMLGTPAYMPPEQTDGRTDARSDVYAVGAVLYEMLTGQPPFAGESGIQVVHAILTREPVWPRVLRPEVSAELDAICRMALAKKPEARYPTAAALAEDLARFLAGEPPLAVERVAAARGRPRAALVAGGVALLALAVGGGLALGGREETSASQDAPPPATEPPPDPPSQAPAQPAPLWTLPPEGALYDLSLDARSAAKQYQFTARLEIKPAAEIDPAADLRLACRVTTFKARTDFGFGPTEWDYETTSDEQPLSPLRAGVNKRFECRLDRRTGAVTDMTGYAAIRAAIMELAERNEATSLALDSFGEFVGKTLNDQYIEAAMDALTRVAGGSRRVPWEAAEPGGLRFTPDGAPQPHALPDLSFGIDAPVSFTGEAEYEGGRLHHADLRQVFPAGSEQPRSTITWSMTRR